MGHNRHEISVACGSQGSTGRRRRRIPRTSGRRDQLMASRAAAVPQDPGNNVPVCGQVLLARGNVQSREVAARPRPTPVEAADDVGINNRVDIKKDGLGESQVKNLVWHGIA